MKNIYKTIGLGIITLTILCGQSIPAKAVELTQADLLSKAILCDNGIPDSVVSCRFQVLSTDSLPSGLKLAIGNGFPSGFCLIAGSQATCSGVSVGDNNDSKVYIKIGTAQKVSTTSTASLTQFDNDGNGIINELDSISNTFENQAPDSIKPAITIQSDNPATTSEIATTTGTSTTNGASTTINTSPTNSPNYNSITTTANPSQAPIIASQNTSQLATSTNTQATTTSFANLQPVQKTNTSTSTTPLVRSGGFESSIAALIGLLVIMIIGFTEFQKSVSLSK